MDDRVAITGIGLVTPLGADRETTWSALAAGRGAAIDGVARCPLPSDGSLRAVQLARAATDEALGQADIGGKAALGERWGCTVSCSKPLMEDSAECRVLSAESETFATMPGLIPPGVVVADIARRHGVAGPVMNLSAACATGLQSVMTAAEWIREGRCDAALAGASESSLHPLYISGFAQMGVLSESGRARPFDRKRDGFVIAEGAAVFVLERREAALRRGATVFAELAGWDISCDASHATRFNSNGEKIARSLARSLRRANASDRDIDYVNAHGTATVWNDKLEAAALESVFSPRRARVSSTKGATGHMLGATGAVELAFCCLALRDGVLPPTLHLEEPLSDRLDFLSTPVRDEIRQAATLSFGFGGSLATMIVRKPA